MSTSVRVLSIFVSLMLFAACEPTEEADAGTDGAVDAAVTDAGVDAGPVYLDAGTPVDIDFPAMASPSSAEAAGSFRFGVASAATQIEDMNDRIDWHAWTLPEDQGGLGRAAPIGDAVQGYTQAIADVALLQELNLDTYRFSVEWGRVEPERDQIGTDADMDGVPEDNVGLNHYSDLIDALIAAGIRPMVTLHHFSNPLWVHDPRIDAETCTMSDSQLCGWADEESAPLLIEEIREHAAMLARAYGDRVDEWGTFNEPVNYLLASYGLGVFPPGQSLVLSDFPRFMRVFQRYAEAHHAMLEAIKLNDTIDADGDGVAASVGLTLSIADWVPARDNRPSDNPEDVAAANRMRYIYHFLMVDAVLNGTFDLDIDEIPEEDYPELREVMVAPGSGNSTSTLDWLGVQYYFRAGVTGRRPSIIREAGLTPCVNVLDFGACLPPIDDTHWVPTMHYEYWERGLYTVIMDFAERYPNLPMMVTEAGIATAVGARRAENVVRTLEQIQDARNDGADVRGYYHWTLMDNFEWAEGYGPQFGLYSVDRTGSVYARTATEGATVFGEIAGTRQLTVAQRNQYGGYGPMTPEPESSSEE